MLDATAAVVDRLQALAETVPRCRSVAAQGPQHERQLVGELTGEVAHATETHRQVVAGRGVDVLRPDKRLREPRTTAEQPERCLLYTSPSPRD